MPYYIKDPKRGLNFDNYPCRALGVEGFRGLGLRAVLGFEFRVLGLGFWVCRS